MPIRDLDTDQRHSAVSTGREVVVSAGAGSGKTRLLVGRYLHLLKSESISIKDIVAITFTEKAANQMKAAIVKKARDLASNNDPDRAIWDEVITFIQSAQISTIHGFCNSILRSYPLEAGLDPQFAIADETTLSILKRDAMQNFLRRRMYDVPEKMDTLIGVFGISGLKRMYRVLLDSRAQLITYLDGIGEVNASTFERRYSELIGRKIAVYLQTLKEYHAFGPREDSLMPVLNDWIDDLDRIVKMVGSGLIELDVIAGLIDSITSNIRKGSKTKWAECNYSRKDMGNSLKGCRTFLETVLSFYKNEKGQAAEATALLLSEFELLNNQILAEKKAQSYLDHDDTLIETWKLLRNNVGVCQKVARSYKHILVDEFQDTDSLQMDILNMIAGNSAAALFTVGDPKQSIYRFRGAEVRIFNSFITGLDVEFNKLRINYRSSRSIIEFINHTFNRIMGSDDLANPQFETAYTEMRPFKKESNGAPDVEIAVVEGANVKEIRLTEADAIAKMALELHENDNYEYGDMALILRKKTQTRIYEEAFLDHGIPFANLTSGDIYASPESFDIANLLAWLCDPPNPVHFTALLLSPFFHVSREDVFAAVRLAGKVGNLSSVFLYDESYSSHPWMKNVDVMKIRTVLLELLRLRDRVSTREIAERAFDATDYTLTILADPVKGELSLSIIDLLLESADDFEARGGTVREFSRLMSQGGLISDDTPRVETASNALNILTIHKAKGMEYKVVFLADVSGSVRRDKPQIVFDRDMGVGFSLRNNCGKMNSTLVRELVIEQEHKMEIAESKRLFYVGCTRAEERLIISGGKRVKPDQPDKPAKPPKADQDDLFEKDNWLGWLDVALAISTDGEMSEDTPTQLFRYSRISQSDSTGRHVPADYWNNILGQDTAPESLESDAYPKINLLLQPVEVIPHAGKPEHLSPSAIMDYSSCPALYLYKHLYGLTSGSKSGKFGGLGARYGSFAHSALEKWDMKDVDGIERIVGNISGSDIPADWKVKLMKEMRHFAGTDIFQSAAVADELYPEAPFAFTHEDVMIRGTMDLLFRRGKEWYIVDYKTENVAAGEIDAAVERYRIQLGLYACAVRASEYTVPKGLAIHFLSPGITHELACSEAFINEIYGGVSAVIEGISRGDYSPGLSDLCGNCPYSVMCKI